MSNIWVPHPDQDVDLGALLFNPIHEAVKKEMNKEIFYINFDKALVKNDSSLVLEADVADEILMIGYPLGLWDYLNNFPIIRKGIAATHPAVDFQGKSIGVADIACFPGSSGSPIMIYVSGAYYDKQNKATRIGGEKLILLGLLCSAPFHSIEGKIEIREIPTQQVPIAQVNQFIHLGYYVKAKEVLRLCEHIIATLTNA